ncbi:MAG TPA: sigma-70 family RNA polymerase sigma factor [Pirellulales bacterium]|nr:sigma-70 family RNA polymerase sigma factor [Pirellulales bacterium]
MARKPRAWEDFVDRFLGLIIHVTNHSAQARSIRLTAEDREDLCADVFLAIIKDDFAVLRHFRAQSSLATYLTVVARRVVVRELLSRKSASRLTAAGSPEAIDNGEPERRFQDREEIARLLEELEAPDAEVVRLYHLEGMTYREISDRTGMPENSVGPVLSRARQRLRQAGAEPSPS